MALCLAQLQLNCTHSWGILGEQFFDLLIKQIELVYKYFTWAKVVKEKKHEANIKRKGKEIKFVHWRLQILIEDSSVQKFMNQENHKK